MALGAYIACDCFECGRLSSPPPRGFRVVVGPHGGLECLAQPDVDWTAWDNWRHSEACEHQWGRLVSKVIGEAPFVARVRAELEFTAEIFPLLLGKVLRAQADAGDFLTLEEIGALQDELDRLAHFPASNRKAAAALGEFLRTMRELAETALRVRKPIAF